jgi:hypothetical protein
MLLNIVTVFFKATAFILDFDVDEALIFASEARP